MIKVRSARLARMVACVLAFSTLGSVEAYAKTLMFTFTGTTFNGSFTLDTDTIFNGDDYLTAPINNTSGVYTYTNNIILTDPSIYETNTKAYGTSPDGLFRDFTFGPSLYVNGPRGRIISEGSYANQLAIGPDNNLTSTSLSINAIGGPGAPAPELGMGLISALVAGLGLALTRLRSNPFASLLKRRRLAFA